MLRRNGRESDIRLPRLGDGAHHELPAGVLGENEADVIAGRDGLLPVLDWANPDPRPPGLIDPQTENDAFFSHDGAQLVFRATRFVEDAVRQSHEVAPASFKTKMVRFAQKSPDGSRIVYEALGNLWIANGNGSNPRRLTRGDDFESYPTFSRDGRQIVYSADWEKDKTRDLFVTSIDGYESRALEYGGADLLSVSSDNALAILMNSTVPAFSTSRIGMP